jgi:hypothetical protein
MNNALATQPSLTEIAVALRNATETLAHELAMPTPEPPRWNELEWRIAQAAAAMQGISSLLHHRLLWEGPSPWQQFLIQQEEQSVARHRQIAQLLQSIDSQSRLLGVPVLALKGAELHAMGLYQPGERPMGDVDLMIETRHSQMAARVLQDCGYEAAFSSDRHQVFKPRESRAAPIGTFGEHADNPIKVEVHTEIAERLPFTKVDITARLFPRLWNSGLNQYPSIAAVMMHLLLHAAGNIRARALRLIQLHDIALLAVRFGPTDWEDLIAASGVDDLWWAWPPLTLLTRYYPDAIPPAAIFRLSANCPWLLRKMTRKHRLTDVSWSNIRIAAFPGLEWARTPRDAVGFMRSRIWPSRKVRLELAKGTAEIPGVTTVPWYRISHPARILRWIFSRPPRVQTLLSVRAALGQDAKRQ